MSWFRLLPNIRSPLLPNTGSTARDHLASERTFLAWLRTGLGFVALGMAVERCEALDLDRVVDRLVRVGAARAATGSMGQVGAGAQSGDGHALGSASQVAVTAVHAPGQVPPTLFSHPDSRQALAGSAVSPPLAGRGQSNPNGNRSSFSLQNSSLLITSLFTIGSGVIGYGTTRYFANLRLIRSGLFRPAFHGIAITVLGVSGLTAGVWWSSLHWDGGSDSTHPAL